MVRWITRALAIAVVVAIVLIVLDFAELLVPVDSGGTASMAPTIPACNGRAYTQGFTYKFHDPQARDIVAIHAAEADGKITPDRDARDLVLTLRVVGGPGDQVVGRNGNVFVNGLKFDDIRTAPFRAVEVGGEQYFVLGDNRSASVDSRQFGPVLRNAIFGRVFVVFWPLRDVTFRTDLESGAPPGPVDCGERSRAKTD